MGDFQAERADFAELNLRRPTKSAFTISESSPGERFQAEFADQRSPSLLHR